MMRIDTINGCTNILLIGDALLVGGGAFYYCKTYKGGKSKAPKQSVSEKQGNRKKLPATKQK